MRYFLPAYALALGLARAEGPLRLVVLAAFMGSVALMLRSLGRER